MRRPGIKINRNLNGSVKNRNLWAIKRGKQPVEWTLHGLLVGVVIQQPSITRCSFLRCLQEHSAEFEAKVLALVERTGERKYIDALHDYEPRSVFTKYHAESVEPGVSMNPDKAGMERLFFNPTKGDTFHHFYRGEKVQVDTLAACSMDARGQMWGRE